MWRPHANDDVVAAVDDDDDGQQFCGCIEHKKKTLR